jgi:hypothetical protein
MLLCGSMEEGCKVSPSRRKIDLPDSIAHIESNDGICPRSIELWIYVGSHILRLTIACNRRSPDSEGNCGMCILTPPLGGILTPAVIRKSYRFDQVNFTQISSASASTNSP